MLQQAAQFYCERKPCGAAVSACCVILHYVCVVLHCRLCVVLHRITARTTPHCVHYGHRTVCVVPRCAVFAALQGTVLRTALRCVRCAAPHCVHRAINCTVRVVHCSAAMHCSAPCCVVVAPQGVKGAAPCGAVHCTPLRVLCCTAPCVRHCTTLHYAALRAQYSALCALCYTALCCARHYIEGALLHSACRAPLARAGRPDLDLA